MIKFIKKWKPFIPVGCVIMTIGLLVNIDRVIIAGFAVIALQDIIDWMIKRLEK